MPVSRVTVPATYADLKKAVEAVVFRGRQQIEQAWVQTYHETGRLINDHIVKHQRAGYGAKVFDRLAGDTGISKRTLHECAQFHRCFPIVRTCAQLGWAHYRTLCQVSDEKARHGLLREAVKHEWTVAELVQRVRPLNATLESVVDSATATTVESPPRLLTAKRGTPGVYRVVARGEALAADLGFKLYVELGDDTAFQAGGFVRFDARGRPLVAEEATKADLFTYTATVRRVVDGDTLEVDLPLPRGYAHLLKLRLRALDCPELDTPAGKAAKRFTESLLAPASTVTIVTSKPDKYDRYLADVFVPNGGGEFTFLNNELLKNGHAVRKDDWSLTDWEY